MTEAEVLFNQITQLIPDGKPGKMFGALCIKTPNGKAAAMFWKEALIVKLHGDIFDEAMSLDGSQLFEPMEGRPMKKWVQIPYNYQEQWLMFAEEAAKQVRAIEVIKPVKKK